MWQLRIYIYIFFIYRGYNIALLYSLLISGQREFCYEYTNQTNTINSTTNTNASYDDEVKKFTDVARDITFYSVCIEVGFGYLTITCFLVKFACCTKGVSCSFACGGFSRNRLCLCCFHSESYMKEFSKAITPFLFGDALLFLAVAPISNIHPFIVTCIFGYVLTGLRLASVVLTFVLLFGFRYYKNNEFKLKELVSLAFDFVGLFLAVFSVSSSLATLISLGIPEMKSIRISYAIATFINVVITYIKYYTTVYIIHIVTNNTKSKPKEICLEVMNHLTFWIKLLFGDIVLIVLNLIIWTQHFEEDFRYAGVSLISTVASTVVAIIKYTFVSPFCQSNPLYKQIGEKLKNVCGCGKEKTTIIN